LFSTEVNKLSLSWQKDFTEMNCGYCFKLNSHEKAGLRVAFSMNVLLNYSSYMFRWNNLI